MFESEDDANTPLTSDERDGLIPSYIALRRELNEAEQINISQGQRWAESRMRDVLDRSFLCELHRRMFGDVWRWAGRYRTTARNIGVDAYRIAPDVQDAIDNARYWIEHATYSSDELAIRFSHRLVAIHPFPNGNGRFSRLVGDLLAWRFERPPFTWGRLSLLDAGKTRSIYVDALRAADRHNFEPLVEFGRS